MLVIMLQNVSSISGLPALKISAGRPSIPNVFTDAGLPDGFLYFIQNGQKIKVIHNCFCGIKSRVVGSTAEDLLSRLEKCFLHCCMKLPLSLRKVYAIRGE